jgi:ATP-dependent Clp protease ATP-binding subunit ClpB
LSESHTFFIPGIGDVSFLLCDIPDEDTNLLWILKSCVENFESDIVPLLKKCRYGDEAVATLLETLHWHACMVNEWETCPLKEEEETQTIFKRDPRKIEESLKSIIKGQNRAIDQIMPLIKRAHAGLNDPFRPLGIVMLCGNSGVGKTLTAKAISSVLFEDEVRPDSVHATSHVYRIDCAELVNKGDINRIMGAPAGYVGHDNGSPMAKFVEEHPGGCVILVDEAEKADESVRNFFLGVFDRGQINDNTGKVVNLRNCLFVLTTNIGSKEVESAMNKNPIGFSSSIEEKSTNNITMEAIREKLAPEFRNRLDETIIFEPLDSESLRQIVKIEAGVLRDRLKRKGSNLKILKKAEDLILSRSNTHLYGGREIRRVIERDIATPISERLADGESGTFTVNVKREQFVFGVK